MPPSQFSGQHDLPRLHNGVKDHNCSSCLRSRGYCMGNCNDCWCCPSLERDLQPIRPQLQAGRPNHCSLLLKEELPAHVLLTSVSTTPCPVSRDIPAAVPV